MKSVKLGSLPKSTLMFPARLIIYVTIKFFANRSPKKGAMYYLLLSAEYRKRALGF
jgi:hypothetical protein